MGLGPVTPYRSARGSVVWERVRTPVRLALGATALAVFLAYRNPFLLLGVLTATFAAFVILRNLYHSARTSGEKLGLRLPAATLRVMRNDPGYWGGQISHFGVAILALGIAISANASVSANVSLGPGETATVAGYDITYLGEFTRQEANRFVIGADVQISREGRLLGREQPRINQYDLSDMSVATPAVKELLTGDLYLSLKSVGPDGASLGVWWFPFIWLIWTGGLLAGLAILWSRLVRRPGREAVPIVEEVADER
jgi:cytochrome c-type biogenesis protein CcmF